MYSSNTTNIMRKNKFHITTYTFSHCQNDFGPSEQSPHGFKFCAYTNLTLIHREMMKKNMRDPYFKRKDS